MTKYLVLIGLFLVTPFSAQNKNISPEKVWKYYGMDNGNDFTLYIYLFTGRGIVSPIVDRYQTGYELKWGMLDVKDKTILPIISYTYPLEIDQKKRSRIPVDFISKEVLDRVSGEELPFVMYVTPKFKLIADVYEYYTGVILDGEDIRKDAYLKCQDYLTDNLYEQNYNKNQVGSVDNISLLMDSWYRDCVSKNLKDKINNRMDEWGVAKRKRWENW